MGLPIMEILGIIGTQYPDAVEILKKPGVFQVYVDYINASKSEDGKTPWTKEQFQAALRATPYYQATPKSVRDSDILLATDPATFREQSTMVRRTIDDIERQTGIKLDDKGGLSSPAFAFLVDAVKYGWDAQEIKYRIIASVNAKFEGGGEIGKTMTDVKKMADEYGVPMSDFSVELHARRMAEGALDQNALQGYLVEQAKSLFPALGDALDRGITVKQYADPYLQLAQQELGVNPADISLTDQKWMKPLNQIDPKTGQRVSMNLDDWLKTIRSDESYGYDGTSKARADATQLATALQAKFGAA